jgi:hypothetical protein
LPFYGALADAFASSAAAKASATVADDRSNEAEAAAWLLPEPYHGQKDGSSADVFFADSDTYLDLDFAHSMDDIMAIGVRSSCLIWTSPSPISSNHSMNRSVSI